MIHAYIDKAALIEASEISTNGIAGLIEWCMVQSGMEKHGGPIYLEHVRKEEWDSVLVISTQEKYTPEEVLYEVLYDNDPQAGLLVTQDQKLNA
jgi:hypothetical protein